MAFMPQQPKRSKKPSFIPQSQMISQVNSLYNSRNFDQTGFTEAAIGISMMDKTQNDQSLDNIGKFQVRLRLDQTAIMTDDERAASKESAMDRVTTEGTTNIPEDKQVVKHKATKISIIKRKYVEGTPIKLDQSVFQQFIAKANNRQSRKPLVPTFNTKMINSKMSQKSYIEPQPDRTQLVLSRNVNLCTSLRQSFDDKENTVIPNIPNQPRTALNFDSATIPKIKEALTEQILIKQRERQAKCKMVKVSMLSLEQASYINNYETVLLDRLQSPEYEGQTCHVIFKNHPTLTYDLRSKIIDWMYNAVIKSKVDDKNVFFLSVKLLDLYYTNHPIQQNKDTLQLVGATTIFMSAKMLEVQFLDLDFCEQRFLHHTHSKSDVLRVEQQIVEYSDWKIVEDSLLDCHALLLGMIKTRFQKDTLKLSKFIFLFIKDKLDVLLLNELMVLTCLPKYLHLSDIIKVAALIEYKISSIRDRVRVKDFTQVTSDYDKLCKVWDQILSLIAAASNRNYFSNLGCKINSEIHNETLNLQENEPDEFAEYIKQTRQFEKLALTATSEQFPDIVNFLKECKYQRNLTHSVYKCLKSAMLKRNLDQIRFYLYSICVDLTQPNFNGLLHQFIVQSCTQERNHMLQGKYYEGLSLDEQILDLFVKGENSQYSDYLLRLQDEGYGNTPLHVACGLYSYVFIRKLIDAGSDLSIRNAADLTPEDIIDEEIKAYKIYLDSQEKQNTLERLSVVKNLFAEYKGTNIDQVMTENIIQQNQEEESKGQH
ncbi:n-terminal domain containing protein [Stylonychia lemnae]|uniref:N-terminal domain containing protein n=1 Tax=Stylonychia lemnae TaxID=5949 RepID=A0A078AG07_STYLE|nr:n-terminal domain containing protein [Stylonychia lemnae]|eukprot:CDW81159.1 n-terminal domain containing protein [Stylonychia lemnae]